MTRVLVLVLSLVPFAVYAAKDAVAHVRVRRPSWKENGVHVVLFLQQGALVVAAFRGSATRMALAGLGILIAGAVDEWGFHRGLPAVESDLHAKAHLALFGFAAVGFALALFPGWTAVLDAARGSS